MINKEIVKIEDYIDFTLIDARATNADLEKVCDVAYKKQYCSVCVNSGNVKFVSGYVKSVLNNGLKISTMVGYPLGASSVEVKSFEVKCAVRDGADEISCVVNIGKIKSGDFAYVKNEISKLRKLSKGRVLKIIVEACYLNDNELVALMKVCAKNKVDIVETSTGFGAAGVALSQIKLMIDALNGKCGVKVSGGIKNREQAIEFINLGVCRIGTSKML